MMKAAPMTQGDFAEKKPANFLAKARHALAVAAGFTLLYTLLFSPVLVSGGLLAPGGSRYQTLAGFRSARSIWDPTMLGGFPGLADPERLSWYPPALMAAAMPGSWNVFVISGYVLASCFAYAYVWTLTRSWLSAMVAGGVFGMSGFMIAHLSQPNLIHALAWLPAILLCLERLRERASAGWLAAAAMAAASAALTGHREMLVYESIAAAVYSLCAGWAAPAGCGRYYRAALAAGVLGLGLSAILFLPLHQLAKGSVAAELDCSSSSAVHLSLTQLPQVLFPYAYGGSRDVPFFGQGTFAETTSYLGLLPLVLTAFGAFWGDHRRLARFWLGLAACSFLMSLLPATALSPLFAGSPLLKGIWHPGHHLGELSLAIAVLSGWGVAALAAQDKVRRLKAAAFGSLALTSLVGVGFLAWLSFHGDATGNFGAARAGTFAAPVMAVLLGLAAFWAFAVRTAPWTGVVLAASLALDLGVCATSAEWRWQHIREADLTCPTLLAKYRDELGERGQRLGGFLSPPNTPADAAPPNLPALWRLPTIGGFHPLVPMRTAQFLRFTDKENWFGNGLTSEKLLTDDDCALDLLATRYLMVPKALLSATDGDYQRKIVRLLSDSARFRHVDESTDSVAFINQRALPRAWLVHQVRQLAQGDVLRAVHSSRLPDGSRFDPVHMGLVEDAAAINAPPDPAATAIAKELTPGKVQIETGSASASFCVLSDIYYPGWRATVDGQPAEILRTNSVLMGLALPAGRHTVLFEYVPMRFYLGAGVSLCSLLVVVGMAIYAARAPAASDRLQRVAPRPLRYVSPNPPLVAARARPGSHIELDRVSLTFNVRKERALTLKEFIVGGLFLQRVNPRITVEALRDVTLSIGEGERLGIIGHNGAGKSTLLKLLAGIYPPTSGRLRVQGRISSLFDIALGFEGDATGWENIGYRSYLQGETPKTVRNKAQAIAEFSELGDFLNMPVRYYSAGMSVRLAFSIATAIEPEILLVDEVLSVGDLAFREKAQRRMHEMMTKAKIIVMVSHDLDSIANVCQRVIWMEHGEVHRAGPAAQVIAAYQRHYGASKAA